MKPLPYRHLARRAPAVLAGVLLAHVLPWHGLRAATAGVCVQVCQQLGMQAQFLPPSSLGFPGWNIHIATSCTMIDVYLGALPLLWTGAWGRDLRRFLLFFLGLMTLNVARLVAGFWLVHQGVSWELGHEVVAGVVFYLVLEWVCAAGVERAPG